MMADSSNEAVRSIRARRLLVGDVTDVAVVYLLMQLRKANRRILRLNEVVSAARDGDVQRLRSALARLRPGDVDARPARRGPAPHR